MEKSDTTNETRKNRLLWITWYDFPLKLKSCCSWKWEDSPGLYYLYYAHDNALFCVRAQRVKDALLTPQYELDIITPQNEAAPRRPISKISIQNFEKVENLNSRIWKIVVQGIHITKYLRICNPSREWQTFQIQIGRLGAASYWRVKGVSCSFFENM